MKAYKLKSWVMSNGERYCALVAQESGLPIFYPMLYVTTQVRNRSLSHAAMEQTHCALAVLLNFCEEKSIGLENRLIKRIFFTPAECDSIRDYCKNNFRPKKSTQQTIVVPIKYNKKSGQIEPRKTVAKHTLSTRLTHIAHYTAWLAQLLNQHRLDEYTVNSIRAMESCFLALRPTNRQRHQGLEEQRGLCKEQERELMQIIRPGDKRNPFHEEKVQIRNQLIIVMMRHLGIRSGELLNIRIEDIDFRRNEILIKRRADQIDDPRKRQPLVKTLARRLLMDPHLAELIRNYIVQVRRLTKNARRHPYLLITHKAGPTLGAPMSRANFNSVIRSIALSSEILENFSSHDLRHTWNERFSEWMDTKDHPESHEEQEKIRENWMGWREGSGTAAIYNKRFAQQKALDAGLALQKSLIETQVNVVKLKSTIK